MLVQSLCQKRKNALQVTCEGSVEETLETLEEAVEDGHADGLTAIVFLDDLREAARESFNEHSVRLIDKSI